MSVRAWGQVFVQLTAPEEDPVIIGSLWSDTTTNTVKVCTAVSPYTYAAVSSSITVPGSNTQVIFNDGGALGADAGLTYNKTTDALTIVGGLVVDTSTLVVDATNNRVGIGNASPGYGLHVGVPDSGVGEITMNGTYFRFQSNTFHEIVVENSGSSSSLAITGGGNAVSFLDLKSTYGTGTADYIKFRVGDNGATEALRIISSGKVGINTATPAAQLAINGGVHVGGDSDAGDNNLLVDGDATVSGTINANGGTIDSSTALRIKATSLVINPDTSDGSDNGSVAISGGGGSALDGARGAGFQVFGNNGGGNSGTAVFIIGDSAENAGAEFRLQANSVTKFGLVGGTGAISHYVGDNQTGYTMEINATQANVTAGDVFMAFRSTSGLEASIAGTGAAGVIAYNTFTGAHKTLVVGPEPPTFALMEMTGERVRMADWAAFPTKAPKEFLPKTRICTTQGSKACFGVFGGFDTDGLGLVLALGTGWIFVINTGSNLAPGDLLISSATPGRTEKQADDIKRSSSVAVVSESVLWDVGETQRRVACRYLFG